MSQAECRIYCHAFSGGVDRVQFGMQPVVDLITIHKDGPADSDQEEEDSGEQTGHTMKSEQRPESQHHVDVLGVWVIPQGKDYFACQKKKTPADLLPRSG